MEGGREKDALEGDEGLTGGRRGTDVMKIGEEEQ